MVWVAPPWKLDSLAMCKPGSSQLGTTLLQKVLQGFLRINRVRQSAYTEFLPWVFNWSDPFGSITFQISFGFMWHK